MEANKLAGYILLNKPKDISSFACIKKMQKLIGRKYGIGHTGTLDPFAIGLLIIAIDRTATKHIDLFLKLDKVYIATGKLGELTDTLDHTGTIISETNASAISEDYLLNAIKQFGTGYTQIPPMFAALKHQGTPLYKLARNQQLSTEELTAITQGKQRNITLHSLELVTWEPPFFTIKAHVSHGTYIRSLVNDIAVRAGTCATTYELERTAIGPFDIKDAVDLDALQTYQDVEEHVQSIEIFLKKL